MTEKERACLVIEDYAMDLAEPRAGLKKSVFNSASYSKWAAEELLHQLNTDKIHTPKQIIEQFRSDMGKYSRTVVDYHLAFAEAYKVSCDIYEILGYAERKG